MKRLLICLTLIAGLLVGITPSAQAETVTFPCGGTATYSVLMPVGVAMEGNNCIGSLTIDGSVKIISKSAFASSLLTSVTIN